MDCRGRSCADSRWERLSLDVHFDCRGSVWGGPDVPPRFDYTRCVKGLMLTDGLEANKNTGSTHAIRHGLLSVFVKECLVNIVGGSWRYTEFERFK